MAKDKKEKTNAMRRLDALKIQYGQHYYDGEEALSGTEVAAVLGQDPGQCFKTLVTVGRTGEHYVFMVPVADELDLKKAAKAAGDKNMEMVAVKELLNLTGYIRGGCSPVGMKKKYPTYLDETCILWPEIAVSAGARGHQMILPPDDLCRLVHGQYCDLIQ